MELVMSDKTVAGVHRSFWAIGIMALLWNVMGVINFLMQGNADVVAAFPETHRTLIEGRPAWATAAFAIAVFGGALACILLLFRKSAAYYVFIASLLGVMVVLLHSLGIMAGSAIDFSHFEIVMMFLMSPMVSVLLIWYSKQSMNKGWIR